jgi:peptidoglycan-associated lipoprotein
MYRQLVLVLVSATLLVTAGCSGKSGQRAPKTADAMVSTDSTAAAGGAGAATGNAAGADSAADGQGSGASAPGGVARVIYFDFDSSEIRPEFVPVIAAHAHALARNASIRVRLEGHTDERGSPEYNIGLGERRAQAVRRALLLQGVAESQVATVSYGEERPAVTGQTEASWARNRRVEFVYQN